MWRLLGALAAFVLVAATVPSATRASFPDEKARVYTLLHSDQLPRARGSPGIGRLRDLPDGSVLFMKFLPGTWRGDRKGELWRLRLDGRVERLRWAGMVRAVTAAPDGTVYVLRLGTTKIERLDLATRRRFAAADLAEVPGAPRLGGRRHASILALGDGSIIAAYERRIWRIPREGPAVQLQSVGNPAALLALGPAEFAFLTALGSVFRFDANGAPRKVASAPSSSVGTTPDGRILLTTRDASSRPELTVIDPDGARHRHAWDLAGTLGGGDGRRLSEVAWPEPASMTVTADGSLLVATRRGQIRALIPPESRRPRIAVSPHTYTTIPDGIASYDASRPGKVLAELRRGERTIARAQRSGPAGEGRLSFRARLPRGRYELRLTLRTRRTFAQTREIVDFRARLPIEEASMAVEPFLAGLPSADAARGPCLRRAPRTASCSILGEFVKSAVCEFGFLASQVVVVALRPDGRFDTRSQPATATRGAPESRLVVPRRTRLGSAPSLRAQVMAPEGGRATVRPSITGLFDADISLEAISRTLSPGQTWHVDLPIPPAHIRTIRRDLRRGEDVHAQFSVNVDVDAGPGPARCLTGASTELAP